MARGVGVGVAVAIGVGVGVGVGLGVAEVVPFAWLDDALSTKAEL